MGGFKQYHRNIQTSIRFGILLFLTKGKVVLYLGMDLTVLGCGGLYILVSLKSKAILYHYRYIKSWPTLDKNPCNLRATSLRLFLFIEESEVRIYNATELLSRESRCFKSDINLVAL